MDGWAPADWALLPLKAFDQLAVLLNVIEEGAPWPEGVLHGKATFLCKTPEPSLEALDYRILLILPLLYRRWASVRLANLRPWVASWSLDCMFAGIPGKGADEAWYESAVRVEHAKLHGNVISGAASDIQKCFDQISRLLLCVLLVLGGMPLCLARTYLNFHENLRVYNSLAGGLGKPYFKKFSIPQGCPFSMMFIAFLLRVVANMCQTLHPGVFFRMLADDILILYVGQQINLFVNAFEAVNDFLKDMGAIVSAKKSFTFSSDSNFRAWLRAYHWKSTDSKLQVHLSFRDLGAQLSVGNRMVGTMATKRMGSALDSIRRIRRLPLSYERKATLLLSKSTSLGLYGCEVSPISDSAMSSMTAAIANTVAPAGNRKCNGLVFSFFLGVRTAILIFRFLNDDAPC